MLSLSRCLSVELSIYFLSLHAYLLCIPKRNVTLLYLVKVLFPFSTFVLSFVVPRAQKKELQAKPFLKQGKKAFPHLVSFFFLYVDILFVLIFSNFTKGLRAYNTINALNEWLTEQNTACPLMWNVSTLKFWIALMTCWKL